MNAHETRLSVNTLRGHFKYIKNKIKQVENCMRITSLTLTSRSERELEERSRYMKCHHSISLISAKAKANTSSGYTRETIRRR